MGETDLDTVYKPVARTLKDGEVVMILGVLNERSDDLQSRHGIDGARGEEVDRRRRAGVKVSG